jgi:O-antigen/teichoic acid export membrane protein
VIFPLVRINPVITKVAFPAFSKIQDDNPRLRKGYCKVVNYISVLTFPMLAGMLMVAPEFIRLVYGAKWEPSILILQILCLVGVFKSLGNPISSVLLSKGRADIGFYWNVFAIIMVSIAVIVGVNWGILGVAIAILILQAPSFFIIQPIVNRLIDLKFKQYIKAIESPFICSVIMVVGIILLRIILKNSNMLSLFITIIVGGVIIYTVSYYIKDRDFFIELKSILKGS